MFPWPTAASHILKCQHHRISRICEKSPYLCVFLWYPYSSIVTSVSTKIPQHMHTCVTPVLQMRISIYKSWILSLLMRDYTAVFPHRMQQHLSVSLFISLMCFLLSAPSKHCGCRQADMVSRSSFQTTRQNESNTEAVWCALWCFSWVFAHLKHQTLSVRSALVNVISPRLRKFSLWNNPGTFQSGQTPIQAQDLLALLRNLWGYPAKNCPTGEQVWNTAQTNRAVKHVFNGCVIQGWWIVLSWANVNPGLTICSVKIPDDKTHRTIFNCVVLL